MINMKQLEDLEKFAAEDNLSISGLVKWRQESRMGFELFLMGPPAAVVDCSEFVESLNDSKV